MIISGVLLAILCIIFVTGTISDIVYFFKNRNNDDIDSDKSIIVPKKILILDLVVAHLDVLIHNIRLLR